MPCAFFFVYQDRRRLLDALGPVLLDVGLDVDARGRAVLLRLPAAREPLPSFRGDGSFSLFRSLFARLRKQLLVLLGAVDGLGLLFFLGLLLDDLLLGLLGLLEGGHVALDELAEFRSAAEPLLSQLRRYKADISPPLLTTKRFFVAGSNTKASATTRHASSLGMAEARSCESRSTANGPPSGRSSAKAATSNDTTDQSISSPSTTLS